MSESDFGFNERLAGPSFHPGGPGAREFLCQCLGNQGSRKEASDASTSGKQREGTGGTPVRGLADRGA